MSENKFTKYLIYAIGEIVLVVIGILIALEINNNNQAKINRSYELTMLREIKMALQTDVNEMDIAIEAVEDIKKSVTKLAEVRDDASYPNDSLKLHFNKVRRGGISVTFNYSPYESLKSTGLDKISNDNLRSSITNFYEVQLAGVEFWINDYIKRLLYKRGDMLPTIIQRKVKPNVKNGIQVEYIINHDIIHNNDEFDDFLILSGGYIPIAIGNMSFAKNKMQDLISKIDTELNND